MLVDRSHGRTVTVNHLDELRAEVLADKEVPHVESFSVSVTEVLREKHLEAVRDSIVVLVFLCPWAQDVRYEHPNHMGLSPSVAMLLDRHEVALYCD